MDDEALVVCCSSTALEICVEDVEMADSIVWTNLVPEGTVYVIGKEEFLQWIERNGIKGEKDGKTD